MSEDIGDFLKPGAGIDHAGADLFLRNGHIVTMDEARSVVTAMAIRDGKILATGDDDALAGCVTSCTRVLDLHGRTVLPGLIDVHTHVMQWAKAIVRGEIDAGHNAVSSIAEIAKAVADRTAAVPEGHWIRGAGWDDEKLAERRYIKIGRAHV
jgi:predicted amidohydrolase YtcJ